MDDDEEAFEYEGANLEDEEDFENEDAQRRAVESESESESENVSDQPQVDIIESLETDIDDLSTKFEQGEISFEKYNELLIYNQMRISDEKFKLMNFVDDDKISKDLMSELGSLFSNLKKQKKRSKFDSSIVGGTIDDIFRKYGEALEKELTEQQDFYFESNLITSSIPTVVNLPTPEKYQKQLQIFEQKIAKNDISIEEVYAYFDLRLSILNDNLENNLKHDILYVRFRMDLQMEFASLRSEIELLIGETEVVVNEELDEFNKQHNITPGVVKSPKDLLKNISLVKIALESKITALVKKYDSVQDTVFKKQDSREVLKIINQLREIYIKNQYSKLERRFTDEEIIYDLKNQQLDFIVEKYAQYITSDYFDWAGNKKEEIFERPKYVKRVKMSEKETSLIRESIKTEYFQRKEFEKILATLPKEILLKCADRFIAEGKINEPFSTYTAQDKFINRMYSSSIPIWAFSKYHSESVRNYANEVNKMTDEFMINGHVLEAGWNLGPKVDVGDVVYVDRTNDLIRKAIDKIDEIKILVVKTKGTQNKDTVARNKRLRELHDRLAHLELQLKSYNRYMRAPQLKGIAVKVDSIDNTIDVKLDGTSTIKSYKDTYVSRYLTRGKEIPLYVIADSDVFNPTAPMKETSTLAISRWINVVLGPVTFESREQMSELYDQALEKYNNLSEADKKKVNARVMYSENKDEINRRLVGQFDNGIPNKGPLIYVFPPEIPEMPEKESALDDINYEEFIEYSKNLKEYVDNLTPETNPFVKMGVPVTNQLITKINEKVYPDLTNAIKHTPINGFFKLSSVNDFQPLILDLMSESDKKTLQRQLLTEEQIRAFNEIFFMSSDEDVSGKSNSYRPISNPKITFLSDLKITTDQDEYASIVTKIDKTIKITKIVGEEIFVQGRTAPITKTALEKMLSSSLEKDYQAGPSVSIAKKRDPILASIEWGLSFNPTFQLLDLSKRLRDSIIVHTEPKCRIKVVHHTGRFYSGWIVNPIKEVTQDKQLAYTYKYPLIVTDFTEFLKLYRNNLVVRYESFRRLDILTYEEFTSSNYILKHIKYISQHLKDIKAEDEFNIDIISQHDAHLKVRQEQKNELLEALGVMYGNITDRDTLQNIANEIEIEIHNSFYDIRTDRKTINNILSTSQREHYELLTRFRKSKISQKYFKNVLYNPGNNKNYETYLYKISVTVFNIYRTNNFIQKYIEGEVSIQSIIERDLTKEESVEGPDTVENLIAWLPPTEVLDTMRKAYPDAYDRLIRNGPDITDISVINNYEHEIGKKMTFLNKKLALIELVKLKSWQKSLALLKNMEDSKHLMFLIKHRNAIRSINNITSVTRLNTFVDLKIEIYNCKIQTNDLVIDEYAENIETACYSLSMNIDEYKQISGSILSSRTKLYKMISEFMRGNGGPVDIIAIIAELYLNFGKTQHGVATLSKIKINDWNGIEGLPNELLSGIKKVANSMTDAKERKRKGDETIIKNPELGIQEFKIVKNNEGKFMVKQIDKPIVIDKQERTMKMFLNIIKNNYIPRVNVTIGEEIQKIIDKNELTEQIVDEMNSREIINSVDLNKLRSLTYEQLLNINANVYREPTFVDVIPMSMAKEGVEVYTIKSRGGFLIGGNFPLDAKAYRYRDGDGKIRTRLDEICEWVGDKQKTQIYPPDISIYFGYVFNDEMVMIECVKNLLNTAMFVKISGEDIVSSKEILSKVITEFDMYKSIEDSVIKYFTEHGGNKKLFVNGGTKEEYESFLNTTMYSEAMQKLLGVPNLKKNKEVYNSNITVDDRIEVSILRNGDQKIYRKLYKSRTNLYPVPIRYDPNNYPVYSNSQKVQLAFLINTGHLSPWYKNKIKITKTSDGDIEFEGDLPFVIDETSKVWRESSYYVEQTFRDPMYGLPIVTRIGISPKSIENVEGHHIIKKIKLPENKYVIKEEPFKIKYFRSEEPTQSEVNDFKLGRAQNQLTTNELAKKSGYSIIDSRLLSYSTKYTPDDVWSWDPLKDYKVGAQSDNAIWISKKSEQIAILKDWLRKTGSSSSAFIAIKNEATRYLQMVRINLLSQKQNEITHNKFKKPAKSLVETQLIKIEKAWKKYPKEKLINEAKRIGFYTDDMKGLKPGEMFAEMKSKLEAESKINASQIIAKIGLVDEIINIVKSPRQLEDYTEYARYIEVFIKNELLVISPEVMDVIKDPKKYFTHYNRYAIEFDTELEWRAGIPQFFKKYGNDGPKHSVVIDNDDNYNKNAIDSRNDAEIITETIYEIIKNMSYTTNFGFNKNIINYVNDITLFEKLEGKDKLKIITQFPIMKIIIKLKQKGLKITIWNILTTVHDTWFPTLPASHKMNKEAVEKMKKSTLKYSFETPIEITIEDVINYLGDSYYQNAKYNKGIKHEQIANKYTGNIMYLHPGYKFEKIKSDEVSFIDKTSMTAKYAHNPYITLFRNADAKDPKISIEMLVVGEDLHNNKVAVTSNLGRRTAFLYKADPTVIEPYFNIPDPSHPQSAAKFREVAINAEDVVKFLAKGGNYYTILELPDAELKFRKLSTGDKITVVKHYKSAVKEYFKSKDKQRTYDDLIKKKRLNPLTLNGYIDKVSKANVPTGQLSHFIDTLDILPDFLDAGWPTKKTYTESEFANKIMDKSVLGDFPEKIKNKEKEILKVTNAEHKKILTQEKDMLIKEMNIVSKAEHKRILDKFLNGEKRDIYINIAKPTKRLFTM